MPTMLNDELHVHLYGCLTADLLFEIGKDLWPEREARLEWYANEYLNAWGRRPDWRAYFRNDDGRALLKRDFEFVEAGPFARFQACFNLAIALFPATKHDTTVLSAVLSADRRNGLRYVEYRCPIPVVMPVDDMGPYLSMHAKVAARFASESAASFVPRLAFSLSRDPILFTTQYRILKEVQRASADAAEMIVAIDLCGVEEGNPPSRFAPAIDLVLRDNAKDPQRALAILYHVGESFEDMTLKSSVRWIHEAHRLGVHRLGHALALGLDPASLKTQRNLDVATESVSERRRHLDYLEKHSSRLRDRGFIMDASSVRAERTRLQTLPPDATLTVPYSAEELQETRALQDAVLLDLAGTGAVIECCPTSNDRIGRLGGIDKHPLPRFLKAGMRTVLSSDDPGTFASDLEAEEALARAKLGLVDADIALLARYAKETRSSTLVGRGAE